jgi:hypothetical protein
MSDINSQLLHIVIGGELLCVTPDNCEFKDLDAVDFVGAFGSGLSTMPICAISFSTPTSCSTRQPKRNSGGSSS